MATIKCTYEVDDGYTGKSRPQGFNVDPEDFRDMSDDEIATQLDEIAHEEMLQRVSAVVQRVPETVAAIKVALAASVD